MHPLDAELRRREEFGKPVDIGSDVWVGGGALFSPGVKIGSRAIIRAVSVVTRDITPRVFAAGNLCRVVREINERSVTELSGSIGTTSWSVSPRAEDLAVRCATQWQKPSTFRQIQHCLRIMAAHCVIAARAMLT
jgi:tetrahydrodipicolinate N-succinyltransferase